jgi:hypothetical protein
LPCVWGVAPHFDGINWDDPAEVQDIYIQTDIHTYVYTHIHTYIHTYIHTHTHTHTQTHTHTYIYICIYNIYIDPTEVQASSERESK